MRRRRAWRAAVLASLFAASSPSWDGSGPARASDRIAVTPEVRALVAAFVPRLTEQPYFLPPLPPAGTSVALVTGAVRDGSTVGVRIAATTPEGLALERARAEFDGAPPDAWILVVAPEGGAVRYWVPVHASQFVRHERSSNGPGTWSNIVARRPRPVFAVHVPVIAGALAVFVPVADAGPDRRDKPQILGRLGGRP